jgi:uncharacterized membrane protein (UPF0136 family)
MTMLIAAAVCFALAIASGWLLLIRRLMGRPLPMDGAAIHGVVAGVGLVLVAIHLVTRGGGNAALIGGFVLLVVAALLGLGVFRWHLRRQPIPVGLTLVHVLVATVGALAYFIGASL